MSDVRLGRVEDLLLRTLYGYPGGLTVRGLLGQNPNRPCSEPSVRRALAGLLRKSLVQRIEHSEHSVLWVSVERARKEERRRKREQREREREREEERRRETRGDREALRDDIDRLTGAAVDPKDRQRLARILGMLGSANDAEALVAARQAEAARRALDVSWQQLLRC